MDYERPQIEDQYSDAMGSWHRPGAIRLNSVIGDLPGASAEKFEKAKQDSAMRQKARSDAQSAVEEARQRLL